MRGIRLRYRYVLAIVLVGLAPTGAVAAMVSATEAHEERHLGEALARAAALEHSDPSAALLVMTDTGEFLLREDYSRRIPLVVASGLLLTLLAGVAAWLLVARMDRAMGSLTRSAERIGSGRQAGPVTATGVQETAAIEGALERMRQALACKTISRDYLGVRRDPEDPGVFRVDLRVARFFVRELFHLLGFRRRADEDGRAVFRRRADPR